MPCACPYCSSHKPVPFLSHFQFIPPKPPHKCTQTLIALWLLLVTRNTPLWELSFVVISLSDHILHIWQDSSHFNFSSVQRSSCVSKPLRHRTLREHCFRGSPVEAAAPRVPNRYLTAFFTLAQVCPLLNEVLGALDFTLAHSIIGKCYLPAPQSPLQVWRFLWKSSVSVSQAGQLSLFSLNSFHFQFLLCLES